MRLFRKERCSSRAVPPKSKNMKPSRSRTAAGSRTTVYFPGGNSLGWAECKAFSAATSASRFGCVNRSLQAFIIETICSGPCGFAIESNTNRNNVAVFGHVLVDRVIGEACERAASTSDDRFNLTCKREFLNAREDVVNAFLGEHLGVEEQSIKSNG